MPIHCPQMVANISIPEAHIAEFSLFGSVLRDDFRPDSDVDVLVVFEPDATPQLEAWLDMLDELKATSKGR